MSRFISHISSVAPLGEALNGAPRKRASARAPKQTPEKAVASRRCAICGYRTLDVNQYADHITKENRRLLRLLADAGIDLERNPKSRRGNGKGSVYRRANGLPADPRSHHQRVTSEAAALMGDKDALRCRCVWRGEQCANQMTQEDGLCNWCGNGRTEAQLRTDPNALIGSDGVFFGIGGAGQLHDFRAGDPPGTAAACWYSDSGREIKRGGLNG